MKRGPYKTRKENWDHFLTLPIPRNGSTHKEIADVVGCTKQRISQIEKRALLKLMRAIGDDPSDTGEKSSL